MRYRLSLADHQNLTTVTKADTYEAAVEEACRQVEKWVARGLVSLPAGGVRYSLTCLDDVPARGGPAGRHERLWQASP